MAGKKKFIKNTVKGKRRGSKWPEQVKTACLCDMLVEDNLSAVAKKHGVPESTLRTWYNEARRLDAGGRKSLFDKERERQLRILQHRAAAGARNSVDYISRRLEVSARNDGITQAAREELDEMKLALQEGRLILDEGGNPLSPAEVDVKMDFLKARVTDHPGLSDFAAANYLRALTSVTDKAGQLLGDDAQDSAVQVILPEGCEELMG